jgi:ATP-dependent DNA helicase DinG
MRPQELLTTDGPLADMIPGYTERRSQIAAASTMFDAMTRGAELMINAPTGTGKSFAAGTAAVSYIAAPGPPRRVLVVTGSIPLMDQYLHTDLPVVRRMAAAVGVPLDIVAIKGSNNYLCAAKRATLKRNEIPRREHKRLRVIEEWADTTRTGDVAELETDPGQLWEHFSLGRTPCRGHVCRYAGACSLLHARARARDAQIVVTNYHYLLAQARRSHKWIEGFDAIICDEAHVIADIARTALGWQIGERRVAILSRFAERSISDTAVQTTAALSRILKRFAGDSATRIPETSTVRVDALVGAIHDALTSSRDTLETIPPTNREARADVNAAIAGLEDLIKELSSFSLQEDGYVFYAEPVGKGARLCAAVVQPASRLRNFVWRHVDSVVCMSATLSPMDFVAREIGLTGAQELSVSSPFDSERRLFYLPNALPWPTQRDAYREAAGRHIVKLIRGVGGKVLSLHTSYAGLKAASESLRRARIKHRCQGDASRDVLVRWLRETDDGVLLGTESFWTGIDVPGMSLLVIDRLPFTPPGDPVGDALKDRFKARFFPLVALPQMQVKLLQGIGRAQRKATDRPVVAILDPRICPVPPAGKKRAGYVKRVLKAAGVTKWTPDLKNVLKWVGEG